MRRYSTVPAVGVALLVAAPIVAQALVTDFIQDDAYTGTDAGDFFHTPTILANPQNPLLHDGVYPGILYPVDDPQDWYGFNVQREPNVPTLITVTLTGTDPLLCALAPSPLGEEFLRMEARLVDPEGVPQGEPIVLTHPCDSGTMNHTAQRSGIWRIAVTHEGLLGDPLRRLEQTAAVRSQSSASIHGAWVPPMQLEEHDEGYLLGLGCEPSCMNNS